MQFQIGKISEFLRTPQIYVFRRADYVYNSENCLLVDFDGKNHENPLKIMVFGVYLIQYAKFLKMFRI